MDWYLDMGMGGHSSWGEGGVSTFNIGDNGSSFFILLTPGALCSWFLQMSPNSPTSVFLINSLFNQTNFSALFVSLFNSFALTKSFFACLWFASSYESTLEDRTLLCSVEPCGWKNYRRGCLAKWRSIVESWCLPGQTEVPWDFVELFSSLNACSLKVGSAKF